MSIYDAIDNSQFPLWSRKPQSQALGIDLTESLPDMFTFIIVILVKLYIYSRWPISHSQDSVVTRSPWIASSDYSIFRRARNLPWGEYSGYQNIKLQLLPLGWLYDWSLHTQGNLFVILLNQTEIRMYLPYSDWFGTKRRSVRLQINQKMVNTIWIRFDLIRFRKD